MVVARNIIDPERLPAQGCQAEATPTIVRSRILVVVQVDLEGLQPSNAISSVILQGVDDDGKLRSLTFKRAPTMRNPRILLDPDYLATTGTAPPPRPPISLPPPGDLVLSLRLGAKLGRGGAGLVYEAFVIPNSSSPHLTSSPPVLPPLVVKISFRGKANKLAREAYYYDMCHPLQGASIPRYYGHFRTDVARNVSPVQSNDDGTVGDAISIARKRRSRPVYYDENESDEPLDDDSCGGSSESPEATPSPPPEIEPPDSDIEEIEQSVNSVSILVLERLGSYLPIGVPLSDALLYVQDRLVTLVCNSL